MEMEANQSPEGMGDENNNNLDGAGSDHPSYLSQFPEHLRTPLAEYQSPGDLGEALVDLKGRSENSLQLLGENASEADRATFYTKLGRPDAPEKYQFDEVTLPEGITYDKDMEDTFRKTAFENGLSQAQANVLFKTYNERTLKQHEDYNQAVKEYHEKVVGELKKEWGNDYDGNLEVARRGFIKAGEISGIKDDFVKFMTDSKLGDNPMFIKVFHAFGKAISDDSISGITQRGSTPSERKTDSAGRPVFDYPSMRK